MKRSCKHFIFLGLVAVLAGGCFSVDIPEGKTVILSDVESLKVRADIPEGKESIIDSLVISSNQSWGLNFIDSQGNPVDWITSDITEHLNLSGEMDNILVRLTFDFNRVTEDRLAELRITSSDCEKSISITQSAAERFVMVEERSVSLAPEESEYIVNVISNTSWTATLEEGATADVEFAGASGEGDGTFAVSFGINDNPFEDKTARITVSAEGCPDVNIVFTQRRNARFVIDIDFAEQPFKEPMPTTGGEITDDMAYTFEMYGKEYSFVFGKNSYFQYLSSASAIVISSGTIALPIADDMRLVEVKVKCAATNKKFSIVDKDANTVEGGKVQALSNGDVGLWSLTGTQANQQYYIKVSSGKSRISHITLTYE